MTQGVKKPVAVPCDEETADGEPVRTWDIVYLGRCVASGFRTRREARAEATRRRAAEPTSR